VAVGDQPADAALGQHRGRSLDESAAQRAILDPGVVEGRVHHHEVEVVDALQGLAQVRPGDRDPRIVEIVLGAGQGAAIDVGAHQFGDLGRRQDRAGQEADAAAEVSAAPLQRRQDGEQAQAAGIGAVPAENPGLRPHPKLRHDPGRARRHRGLQANGRERPNRAAEAVVLAPLFAHRATEPLQSALQAGAALVLGRESQQGRARLQRP